MSTVRLAKERRIVEYRVVYSSSSDGMNITINTMISEGWQPLGQVSTMTGASSSIGSCLYQTMVKYE